MSARLTIIDASLTPDGILIQKMGIIDSVSGETIRIAKLTPELLEMLRQIEIDLSDYFALTKMQAANPAVKKLVETFKCYKT
jgi:hypothetical protein